MNISKDILNIIQITFINIKQNTYNKNNKQYLSKIRKIEYYIQALKYKQKLLQYKKQKKNIIQQENNIKYEKKKLLKIKNQTIKITNNKELLALNLSITKKYQIIENLENKLLHNIIQTDIINKLLIKNKNLYHKKYYELYIKYIKMMHLIKYIKIKYKDNNKLKITKQLSHATSIMCKKIYYKKQHLSVSLIKQNICQLCKYIIPSKIFHQIINHNIIAQCTSCQSLLIFTKNIHKGYI